MANLIAVFLLASASSYLFTKKVFRIRLFGDFVLVFFILFFSQIVLVELSLGSVGQLYFRNIFLIHLLIFLTIFLVYSKKEPLTFIKPDIEPFINSNLLLFAFSVFFAFFLVKSFLNLINPPLSPDSLQYHLAFPAAWIRSGRLENPFVIFGGVYNPNYLRLESSGISYFPINAELFFAWLMLPLRNAFLADLGEVPFYFIGILAVYSILRKYAVNKKVALLSGFLWVLIPNIFKQLKTASQIDVICAVLLLLVFDTLLPFKQKFTYKNATLFGIAAGLFVGAKILNIIWLIALTPLILYLICLAVKKNRMSAKNIAIFSSIITFTIILLGGFMYIKNFIFTGNPLFPAEIKIFGKTLFRGLMDKATYNIKHASGDRLDLSRLIFKEGLGVQFLALILPGMFLPIVFFRYLKKRLRPFVEYLLLFVTPLIMLILYSIFLNVYVMRYLFPLLSIGLITAIIFITRLPYGEKYITFISFISIFASAFELAHRYELIVSLLLSLLFFMLLLFYKKPIIAFYKSKALNRAMLAILVLGLIFLTYLNEKYNKEEFQRYPLSFSKKEAWQADIGRAWQWLNKETKEGARIAYTGRQEFYPLFGSRLKNEVKYISVNEKEVATYNKPDGLCRENKNFQAWRENLKKEKIEYLFIALPFFENREIDDPAKFPIEDEWASTHTKDFQLLFSNSLSRIYRVIISDK